MNVLCDVITVYMYFINTDVLDYPIIARIDGGVLTYVNGETDDTVWPG